MPLLILKLMLFLKSTKIKYNYQFKTKEAINLIVIHYA